MKNACLIAAEFVTQTVKRSGVRRRNDMGYAPRVPQDFNLLSSQRGGKEKKNDNAT